MLSQNKHTNKSTKQAIKMHGFRYPQQLLVNIREFQETTGIQFPASAHAALLSVLKQIHEEHSSTGEIQEFVLASYAKELQVAYSTMHAGFKFLEKHNFVYETIKNDTPVVVLANFRDYMTPELKKHELNYFTIPHALFKTNIIAEFVRTSNGRAFELLFSLLNQTRSRLKNSKALNDVEKITLERNMSTLKAKLNRRSKGVRAVIETLEALFTVQYEGLKVRGIQIWIDKVLFKIKPECVRENTDEFEVSPLVAEFSEHMEYILSGNKIKYKPRDLFDVMISFKQEAVDVLKYITNTIPEDNHQFSERNVFLQDYFHRCVNRFESHIKELKNSNVSFKISKSLGAYFRTIFRKNLKNYVEKCIDYTYINDANFKEYLKTGEVPKLYTLLSA